MEIVAPNNTQAMIRHCPISAGGGKESFFKHKIKTRVCLSLDSEAAFDVFQGKAQPWFIF